MTLLTLSRVFGTVCGLGICLAKAFSGHVSGQGEPGGNPVGSFSSRLTPTRTLTDIGVCSSSWSRLL